MHEMKSGDTTIKKSEKGMEGQSVLDADKDAKAVDAVQSGLTDLDATTTDSTGTAAGEEPTPAGKGHKNDPTNPPSKDTPKRHQAQNKVA